jgi:hypothetical protein
MLLATTTGYQTRRFAEAVERLGGSVVFGTDRCHVLEDPWRDGALALRFEQPEASAARIAEFARADPLDAIVPLGDRPTPTAARACELLDLPGHPSAAADACRSKQASRERLRSAGLAVPSFVVHDLNANSDRLPDALSSEIRFPCVLKPLALSASRGVIRADDRKQFVDAFDRITSLLRSPDVQVTRDGLNHYIQVEEYIDGIELAIEALAERGKLRILAIFDKPDPLVGPFFEETLYVTPSRLRPELQAQIVHTLDAAVSALGLYHGPIHAELRLGRVTAPWNGIEECASQPYVLEVAARSIGGLCSRALRFRSHECTGDSTLEDLIVRHALGWDTSSFAREPLAAGVMMIPVPDNGIFVGVENLDAAARTPGVDEIIITAKPTQKLLRLPEGASYLGFIFARARSPEAVERSLRDAHSQLQFEIAKELPVLS